MKNNTTQTPHYYKITNAKILRSLIPQMDGLVLSGDEFFGRSDTQITKLSVYYQSSPIAVIEPIPTIKGGIGEDIEKLTSIAPEENFPRLNWSVRNYEAEKKPTWKKFSQCGKNPKIDLDFLLPGLPRKRVGTLISPGGTGKSLAILQTSAYCVLGRQSLLNQSHKKRKVAYISLEDPDEVLNNRIHDLYHQLNLGKDDELLMDENLLACSARLSVAVNKDSPNPDALIELFEDEQPDLIIVDTARRAHQLEENSTGEMSLFIDILEVVAEALNCAVVILHHTSKGAAFAAGKGEDVGSAASRGSTVLVDNVRSVWSMQVMSKKEAEELEVDANARKKYVKIDHTKCNYQTAMESVWLERTDTGFFKDADFKSVVQIIEEGEDDDETSLFR